jgi:RNA polymerase sigma-70 factor (ECF subfamily)
VVSFSDAEAVVASVDAPERFGVVFDRHYDAIAGYLRRRLEPGIADELAAEAFLQAFRVRDRYDPDRAHVRAWLFGIATRLAARHHRAETRRLRAYARATIVPRRAGCAPTRAPRSHPVRTTSSTVRRTG